jgi:hypothetical protein
MDSTNKKSNTNYGEEHPRKDKFNELVNDGHGIPAAAEGEHKQQQPLEKLNDALEVCSLHSSIIRLLF